MYYKMIANKPTYEWDRGGDPTFVDGNQEGWTYLDKSFGNQAGEPIASRGWRVKQNKNFSEKFHLRYHFKKVQ